MRKYFEFIYENDDLIVVNKSAGVLSIPDRFRSDIPNVLMSLKKIRPEVFVAHRIDKETSGVLLFAKSADVHKELNTLFLNREVNKVYDVLVRGTSLQKEWVIEAPISKYANSEGKYFIKKSGKMSCTAIKMIKTYKNISHLEAFPHTGRTHQIRVHLTHERLPLLTDPVYSRQNEFYLSEIKGKRYRRKKGNSERPLISRSSLHARTISFQLKRRAYSFSAELPKDFRAVIHQLEKNHHYEN